MTMVLIQVGGVSSLMDPKTCIDLCVANGGSVYKFAVITSNDNGAYFTCLCTKDKGTKFLCK